MQYSNIYLTSTFLLLNALRNVTGKWSWQYLPSLSCTNRLNTISRVNSTVQNSFPIESTTMSLCAFPVGVPIKLGFMPGPPTRKPKGTCCLKWQEKKNLYTSNWYLVPAGREKTRLCCQKSKSSPRLSLCLLPTHDVCGSGNTGEKGGRVSR